MQLQIEKTTMAVALLLSALLMGAASVCVDQSIVRRAMVKAVIALAAPSHDLQDARAQSGVVSARGTEVIRPLQRPSVSRARFDSAGDSCAPAAIPHCEPASSIRSPLA